MTEENVSGIAVPETGISTPNNAVDDNKAIDEADSWIPSDYNEDIDGDKTHIESPLSKCRYCVRQVYEKRIPVSGGDGHDFRIAAAQELIFHGAGKNELHDYFRVQLDYDERKTENNLGTLWRDKESYKKRKPWKCSTIQQKCSRIVDTFCSECRKEKESTETTNINTVDSTNKYKNVNLNDVIGCLQAKKVFYNFFKYRDRLQKDGFRPPKGVMLYGYPGCGKTYLVNAIVNTYCLNADMEVQFISSSDITSPQMGNTDAIIKKMFNKIRKSKKLVILIFDEVDITVPIRNSTSSQITLERVGSLLRELDGLVETNNVFCICTTNRPFNVDTAFIRSGRIDEMCMVDMPDEIERRMLCEKYLSKLNIEDKDRVFFLISQHTEKWSGADFEKFATELAIIGYENNGLVSGENIAKCMNAHWIRKDIEKLKKDYNHFVSKTKKKKDAEYTPPKQISVNIFDKPVQTQYEMSQKVLNNSKNQCAEATV